MYFIFFVDLDVLRFLRLVQSWSPLAMPKLCGTITPVGLESIWKLASTQGQSLNDAWWLSLDVQNVKFWNAASTLVPYDVALPHIHKNSHLVSNNTLFGASLVWCHTLLTYTMIWSALHAVTKFNWHPINLSSQNLCCHWMHEKWNELECNFKHRCRD